MTHSSSLATRRYSTKPRARKYIKRYGLLSFARNLLSKYGKQLLDTARKTKLDALKTASVKVVHKASEATGEFTGNKIAEKIVKAKPVPDTNFRDFEKLIIPPEKIEEILNELRKVL